MGSFVEITGRQLTPKTGHLDPVSGCYNLGPDFGNAYLTPTEIKILKKVQLETFGRLLQGQPDGLVGYRLSSVEITDPKVLAASGEAIHPMLVWTGDLNDQVEGMVFQVSQAELQQADAYEVSDYRRVEAVLRSGDQAWVYVKSMAT